MSLSRDGPIDQLVRLAQAGDNEAFAALVQLLEREIYGLLVGLLSNNETARDLTQETFIKAWRKIATLKDVSCFKPWLCSIARNLARDYWRTYSKGEKTVDQQSGRDSEANDIAASIPDPDERLIN